MSVQFVPKSLVSKYYSEILQFLRNGDDIYVVDGRKVVFQIVSPPRAMRQPNVSTVPVVADTEIATIRGPTGSIKPTAAAEAEKLLEKQRRFAEYRQKLQEAQGKPGFDRADFERRYDYLWKNA